MRPIKTLYVSALPVSRQAVVRASAGCSVPRSARSLLSSARHVFPGPADARAVRTTHRGGMMARAIHASASAPTKHAVPIDMAYDLVQPSELKVQDQCLVICHGLFGSKQNWRSLAKQFASKLGMPVYTVDLRNHGTSPHAEPHTYSAMAEDLAHFFAKHNLTSGVNLMGHSMGGKSVMAFALNETLNKPLRSLISVDMSPAVGKISPEFAAYTAAMMEIEKAQVKNKQEADKILQSTEPSLPTRQFLLTNTRQSQGADPHLVFRIPLPLLSASIPQIGEFPFTPPPPVNADSPRWIGPTLFIKGSMSKYINRKNIPAAEAFFPNMQLETLETGHWVHAEKPHETVALVKKFIEGVRS